MESFEDILTRELRKSGLLPDGAEGAKPNEAPQALAERLSAEPGVQGEILQIAERLRGTFGPDAGRAAKAYGEAADRKDPPPPQVDEQA